jgi:hypothetical protein
MLSLGTVCPNLLPLLIGVALLLRFSPASVSSGEKTNTELADLSGGYSCHRHVYSVLWNVSGSCLDHSHAM